MNFFNRRINEKTNAKTRMSPIKGALNLDKKWQSDDFFYIIVNEIHLRFNQFWVILKIS